MSAKPIARHKTALHRIALSRPMQIALDDGLIDTNSTVFDYGCGHGDDLRYLAAKEIDCSGWDPTHRPDTTIHSAHVVNLGYVINVIEDPAERTQTLRKAWKLATKLLVVSGRLEVEARNPLDVHMGDGCRTVRDTFQKYYDQAELREWINQALEVDCWPAGPGIFYVFRDPTDRESFAASRYRRRSIAPRLRKSDLLYAEHESLLAPLRDFLSTRGRLPSIEELPESEAICKIFGSLKRAFTVLRRASGTDAWETIRFERAEDLRLYLALARFDGRPNFSRLPEDLRLDIKALFSNYKRACAEADSLLFATGDLQKVNIACRISEVGKLMPKALYVHISALDRLPPLLRTYEGCARAYLGAVEGANVIKMHRMAPKISYLSYPDFEADAHPALHASLSVDLQTFRLKRRDYRESTNPFILHRKELFLADDHPDRDKFERLTRQEEKAGLLGTDQPIGTREDWDKAVEQASFRIAGHRLMRRR